MAVRRVERRHLAVGMDSLIEKSIVRKGIRKAGYSVECNYGPASTWAQSQCMHGSYFGWTAPHTQLRAYGFPPLQVNVTHSLRFRPELSGNPSAPPLAPVSYICNEETTAYVRPIHHCVLDNDVTSCGDSRNRYSTAKTPQDNLKRPGPTQIRPSRLTK
jgi:hypothetical protein